MSDLLWKLEILSQASTNIINDNNEETTWQGSLKLRLIFTEGSCAFEEQSNLKAGIHKFWYKSWRDFFPLTFHGNSYTEESRGILFLLQISLFSGLGNVP